MTDLEPLIRAGGSSAVVVVGVVLLFRELRRIAVTLERLNGRLERLLKLPPESDAE